MNVPVFTNALGEEVPYDGVSAVDWRIAVYVIVQQAGRLLMLAPRPGERWQLPGGAALPMETLAEAATRECLEETGYAFAPTASEPLFLLEQFFFHRTARTYHHSLLFALRGDVQPERLAGWRPERAGDDRARWTRPTELTRSTVHPNHWRALTLAGAI